MSSFGYADLFNEEKEDIANSTIDDLTITSSMTAPSTTIDFTSANINLTSANITGLTINETNLLPLAYLPMADLTAPGSNTHINIPLAGVGLNTTRFILEDCLGQQIIDSPINLNQQTTLGFYAANSVPYLDASKHIAVNQLTNGQLLIGSSGASPVAANITSSDGSIVITNGAGSIDLKVTGNEVLSTLELDATSNQLKFKPGGGLGTSITINAGNPAANRIYTLPDAGNAANFMLTEGAQTINGLNTFQGQVVLGNNHGLQVGISTIGFNTNEPIKHYNDFGGLNHWIFADTTQAMIYNNPDFSIFAGATTASYVMTEGAQTINASTTFTQPVQLQNTNALKIQPGGTGTYFNINASNPSVSQTFTLPDVATNANFVVSAGTQTLSSKIFTLGGNPLVLQSDNTNAKANQLQIQGQTDTTKILQLGYNTTNNYGSIGAQHGSGAFTFQDQLMINQAGGIVSIANSNAYTTFNNTSAPQLIIFGSGTGDSTCDVLHVRENTNTNAREIWMGYQTAGDYGVIQSVHNNVGWTDTRVGPNGGNLVACNGFKMLNTGLTGYTASSMSAYMESILSTSFLWGTQTLTGISVKLTRIGRIVHVHVPFLHFNTTQNAVVVSSAVIPDPFKPTDATAAGVGGTIYENTTNFYAARCIIAILDMKIYVEFAGGGGSSISANDLQIDAFTIVYAV